MSCDVKHLSKFVSLLNNYNDVSNVIVLFMLVLMYIYIYIFILFKLFPKAPRARYRRIWIYSILLLCPMMVPPFYDFLVPDLIAIAKGTYKEGVYIL